MSDEIEGTWGLVLPFDSDDPEFCRGMEAGLLWARLEAEPFSTISAMIHANNAEMVLRMGEAKNRDVRTVREVDDWLEVEFGMERTGDDDG